MDGDRAVRTDQRHARNVRDPSRVLEQGPDRQRAPGAWRGGVSSIAGASWVDGLSISLLAAQGNQSFHALRQGPSRSRLVRASPPAGTGHLRTGGGRAAEWRGPPPSLARRELSFSQDRFPGAPSTSPPGLSAHLFSMKPADQACPRNCGRCAFDCP